MSHKQVVQKHIPTMLTKVMELYVLLTITKCVITIVMLTSNV